MPRPWHQSELQHRLTQIGDIDPLVGGLNWGHARADDLFEFLYIAAQLCEQFA